MSNEQDRTTVTLTAIGADSVPAEACAEIAARTVAVAIVQSKRFTKMLRLPEGYRISIPQSRGSIQLAQQA